MMKQSISPDCDDGVTRWVARTRGPGFALIWLPVLMLSPILSAILDGEPVTLTIHLAIAALYVVTILVAHRNLPQRVGELCTIGLMALVVIQFIVSPGGQGFLYPLLAIAAATAIRLRAALGIVIGLAISGSFAEGFATMSLSNALQFGFATVMAGASTYLIRCLTGTVDDLRATRRRLAGLAVVEERQRFSRDLHDLLGHTLSVIVVKAEAIRRFADSDSAVGIKHAQEIEDIGRTALADVRQAVAGYREMRFADELSHAVEVLDDAGIEVSTTTPLPDLDNPTDTLFAWAVREGTTNILRHAHASRCTMKVTVTEAVATFEITDDGRGASTKSAGSGLLGVRERAERLGGHTHIRSGPNGFTLTVHAPISGAPQ
ncbi:sensor histidine kinase [Brevibacterium spongiae]|uniref:Sensor histidine kinase n=1 Tax=Brevibacterium spongiae TaxID=2909672 RepID=A0ABY5SQ70_9MICO|nr:sensor histidine kinase [Brevibacterium spongiae]UVI35229.1 sensor histidine kinase [Brevibacterium spongiae]